MIAKIKSHPREISLIFWVSFLIAFLILRIAILPFLIRQNIPCFFHSHFGFYCWSCGLTRMCDHLVHFKLWEAFLYNPYFFLLLIAVLIYMTVFTISAFRKKPLPKLRLYYLIAAVILLFLFTIIRNTPLYPAVFYL